MKRFLTMLTLATDPAVDASEERVTPYLMEYREDPSTDALEEALLRGPDWWAFLWTKPRVHHRIRQEKRKRHELC